MSCDWSNKPLKCINFNSNSVRTRTGTDRPSQTTSNIQYAVHCERCIVYEAWNSELYLRQGKMICIWNDRPHEKTLWQISKSALHLNISMPMDFSKYFHLKPIHFLFKTNYNKNSSFGTVSWISTAFDRTSLQFWSTMLLVEMTLISGNQWHARKLFHNSSF